MAVITVDFAPSSAEVKARAVTIFIPDMAKKLVSLVVNTPANCEPSDIVTFAVATKVPAEALSGIVALAGVSNIAVGVGVDSADTVHTVCVDDIAKTLETIDR